jgi:hypothetical protein
VIADIKHTMARLWSNWKDLPKTKSDLAGYGDNELEMLEALSDEAKTLRERCLEERGIRPGLKISGPVHIEILADAARQAGRDRN